MVMMFVIGRLSARVQPKYLIIVGAVMVAFSMYDTTNVLWRAALGHEHEWRWVRRTAASPLSAEGLVEESYRGCVPEAGY